MGIEHPFAGQALNAVDVKGRVSVPASFRAGIAARLRVAGGATGEKGGTLMIGPHSRGDRLLAYDQVGIVKLSEELRESVADLPALERREALAELRRTELGSLVSVPFDGAGRMVLPPVLRELGGVSDLAYFIGTDDYIEIWAPDRAEQVFANRPTALAMLRSYLKAREA